MLGLTTLLVLTACAQSRSGDGTTASTVADDAVTTTNDVVKATLAAAPTAAPVVSPPLVGASAAVNGAQSVEVAASCAVEYNAATLAERTWAFDGTLVAVSTGNDTRLDVVPTATFTVNQWYRGGTGEEVTVQYEAGHLLEFAPTVGTASRMLVAGEPRWGGQPLDDAIAWGCGFTQPWTSTAADQWSTVFGQMPTQVSNVPD